MELDVNPSQILMTVICHHLNTLTVMVLMNLTSTNTILQIKLGVDLKELMLEMLTKLLKSCNLS